MAGVGVPLAHCMKCLVTSAGHLHVARHVRAFELRNLVRHCGHGCQARQPASKIPQGTNTCSFAQSLVIADVETSQS
jgi:hypothetical protein